MNTKLDISQTSFKQWLKKKKLNQIVGKVSDPFSCPFANYLLETNPEYTIAYVNIDKIICLKEEEPDFSRNWTQKEIDEWYTENSWWSLTDTWHVQFIKILGDSKYEDTISARDLRKLMDKVDV